MLHLYIDGSYDAARKKGGWAFVATSDENKITSSHAGSFDGDSNNTLELVAAVKALEWAMSNLDAAAITIWSDSNYVVEGCNVWRPIWSNNGWKRYNPNPKKRNRGIPDADLWKSMDLMLRQNSGVVIAWCKGHDGNVGNELADKLAREASF